MPATPEKSGLYSLGYWPGGMWFNLSASVSRSEVPAPVTSAHLLAATVVNRFMIPLNPLLSSPVAAPPPPVPPTLPIPPAEV